MRLRIMEATMDADASIVKFKVFLVGVNEFAWFNTIYTKKFGKNRRLALQFW